RCKTEMLTGSPADTNRRGFFFCYPPASGCRIDLRLGGGLSWTHRPSARIVGAANSACLVTVLRRSSVSTADTVFANPRRDGHGRRCKHCQQSRASSRSRGGRLQSMPYGLPAALDSAVPQAYDPIAYLNAPKHSEWQEAPSA